MKKIIFLVPLVLISSGALLVGNNQIATYAEDSYPCQVIIEQPEHGEISTDISFGEVGDIVTITATSDSLYEIEYVAVNDEMLEGIDGVYTFALVEGDNVITSSFILNQTIFGDLSTIVTEIQNQDWENLVYTIISLIFDSGIIIALITYLIRARGLNKTMQNISTTVVPNTTKEVVKTLIEPMFSQTVQDSAASREIMMVLVKCMVLMQQNTPEAKLAILDELAKLQNITDINSVNDVKKYIDNKIAEHNQKLEETLSSLNKISSRHEENVDDVVQEEENNTNKKVDKGTQI